MQKLIQETANRFLSSVPEQNRFWCNDGRIFSNLEELSAGLKSMSKEIFNHHVTPEKNDFSSWVYDVIGDTELAIQLRKSKDKKNSENIVKNRINSLKKIK